MADIMEKAKLEYIVSASGVRGEIEKGGAAKSGLVACFRGSSHFANAFRHLADKLGKTGTVPKIPPWG